MFLLISVSPGWLTPVRDISWSPATSSGKTRYKITRVLCPVFHCNLPGENIGTTVPSVRPSPLPGPGTALPAASVSSRENITACSPGIVWDISTTGGSTLNSGVTKYSGPTDWLTDWLYCRYFLLFLAWTWLGVVYCTYLNSVYVYTEVGLASPYSLFKFIFPLLILMSGMDISWDQVAIFFWSVHVAALLLTSVLLVYHVRWGERLVINIQSLQWLLIIRLIHCGTTTFESNRRIHNYNLGWKQNWIEVLGRNWKFALVWPGAKSRLPHNGVEWDTRDSWRLEAPKNRWEKASRD